MLRLPAPAVLPLLLLCACGIGEVNVNGVVTRSPDPKASALVGAKVDILDQQGLPYDEAITDGLGKFTAAAPQGQTIFALVTNDDGITSSFTGISGTQSKLNIDRGNLWGVPADVLDGWRAQFAGCPDIDQGVLLIGQVRVYLYVDHNGDGKNDYQPSDLPIVNNAVPHLEDPDGTIVDRTACFLDPNTNEYDSNADTTGASGWYAIGNVPPGEHILVVRFQVSTGVYQEAYLTVWVPPSGVVARIPTYVEFPTL